MSGARVFVARDGEEGRAIAVRFLVFILMILISFFFLSFHLTPHPPIICISFFFFWRYTFFPYIYMRVPFPLPLSKAWKNYSMPHVVALKCIDVACNVSCL